MKPIPLRLIMTAGVMVALAVLSMPPGCKDPDDFKPPEDTLYDAPAPPGCLAPPDSYLYIPLGLPLYVTMDWTDVDSAMGYQLELTREGDTAKVLEIDSSYYVRGFTTDMQFGEYVWRVRASSSHWIGGYTGWSPYRRFGVDYQPFRPTIVKPAPAESLFVDSLPAAIALEWTRVRDETYYDIKIFLDSLTCVESVTGDTVYEFWPDLPGHYTWQVRANSWHWQMPGRWAYSDFHVILNK